MAKIHRGSDVSNFEKIILQGIKASETDSFEDVSAFLAMAEELPNPSDRMIVLVGANSSTSEESYFDLRSREAIASLQREYPDLPTPASYASQALHITAHVIARNEKRDFAELDEALGIIEALRIATYAQKTNREKEVDRFLKAAKELINPVSQFIVIRTAWNISQEDSLFAIETGKALAFLKHKHPELPAQLHNSRTAGLSPRFGS